MDKLLIEGGKPLNGEVRASGAKNATLPILCSALLTEEPLVIENVPHLEDVSTTNLLLAQMGAEVTVGERMGLEVCTANIDSLQAPYDLVKTMRASILVLGPLLARYGYADVSLPGGCAIGARPVNLHLQGLQAMGAEITVDSGYIHARSGRLQGAHLKMEQVTVTGTENLMMAATLAEGETVIENAAMEPEVADLANCLNRMGARIKGIGTSTLAIQGVKRLHGAEYRVLPDRIETATFLIAGALTRGRVRIRETNPDLLAKVLEKLREAGAQLELGDGAITLDMQGRRPRAVDVQTAPFPGFPTDLQAQISAMNAVAEGRACVRETVFENRFMHILELQRMGANLELDEHTAVITGREKLTAAPVMATDLRASAGLVLAGLVAEGESTIHRIYHIDRGYECIEEKLAQLGARIRRLPDQIRRPVGGETVISP